MKYATSTVRGRKRNLPCTCGSGKKYKYCHGDRAARQRTIRRQVAEKAAAIVARPMMDNGRVRVSLPGQGGG
jgi:uncharacterized protein YecA (UPF0149 family)